MSFRGWWGQGFASPSSAGLSGNEAPEVRPARVHRLPERVVRHFCRRRRLIQRLQAAVVAVAVSAAVVVVVAVIGDGVDGRCSRGDCDHRLASGAAAAAAGDPGGGHRHHAANLALANSVVWNNLESPQSRCLLPEGCRRPAG